MDARLTATRKKPHFCGKRKNGPPLRSHFPARVGLKAQTLIQKRLKSFFRWFLSAEKYLVIALSNDRFLQS
jgi:hypothetical protein